MRKNIKGLMLSQKIILLFAICIFMIITVFSINYFKLNRIIKNDAKQYAISSMNQLEESLNINVEAIRNIGFNIAYNQYVQEFSVLNNTENRIQYMNFITQLVNTYTSINKDIVDVVLVDKNETIYSFMSNINFNTYKNINKTHNFNDPNFTKPKFVAGITKETEENKVSYVYIVPIFHTYNNDEINKKIGLVMIYCNTNNIQKVFEKSVLSKESESLYMILDEHERIVVSNNKIMIGKTYKFNKTRNNSKYVENEIYIKDMNWKILSIISINEVTKNLVLYKNLSFSIAIIIMIIFIVIGYFINRNITMPLTKIINSINEIGEKNIKQRIDFNITGEIGIIIVHINEMLEKIEHMTKKIFNTQSQLYEAEIIKKQAQLSALQSQINPHFLYNTLECIRSIATAYKSNEIKEIVTAMAKIFRYSIKGDEFVEIEDEIEIIKEYLKIMDIRFWSRFRFNIIIDPEIVKFKIPKMILQPLVENAVYHGLEQKLDNGELIIKGNTYENDIFFIITEIID